MFFDNVNPETCQNTEKKKITDLKFWVVFMIWKDIFLISALKYEKFNLD